MSHFCSVTNCKQDFKILLVLRLQQACSSTRSSTHGITNGIMHGITQTASHTSSYTASRTTSHTATHTTSEHSIKHNSTHCDNNGNTYVDDAVFPDDWIENQKAIKMPKRIAKTVVGRQPNRKEAKGKLKAASTAIDRAKSPVIKTYGSTRVTSKNIKR